jgi:hypothetical protein
MKNAFGLDLLRSSNANDVHCMLPFYSDLFDPVNSSMIMHRIFSRQRFLLASTFLSSSLELKLASVSRKMNLRDGLLQLRREVFTRIIIIPALLPEMCVVTRYFCIFLCPVCSYGSSVIAFCITCPLAMSMCTPNKGSTDITYSLLESPRTHHLPPMQPLALCPSLVRRSCLLWWLWLLAPRQKLELRT